MSEYGLRPDVETGGYKSCTTRARLYQFATTMNMHIVVSMTYRDKQTFAVHRLYSCITVHTILRCGAGSQGLAAGGAHGVCCEEQTW